MTEKIIYPFPSQEDAKLIEVGGKGLSLMTASKEGLPVPPGFILAVTFFTPWLSELKTTKAWAKFVKSGTDELEKACIDLKKDALQFSFTKQQDQKLSEMLSKYSTKALFAVRSSSPEEDLEGSSFAGGYETVLGVTDEEMHTAIKKAFISCLDYRVAVYKQQNGFDSKDPKIAVIIQEQITSDIAGVGFSLNPVTNNFDEAVFTANWGLGETVVAGTATPDTYIVDKLSLKIKDKKLGKKETSLYVSVSGGTKGKEQDRSDEFTLSADQVIELTELIKKVEDLYKKPIDIEWAYFQNKLYLLQARPISTYIPLPPEMITAIGDQKRLYVDFTISVQGIYSPLSIMGTSVFKSVLKNVGKVIFLRDITQDITRAIPWASNGRIYFNVSNFFRLEGKKTFVRLLDILDPLAAKTIQAIEEREYISQTKKIKLLPLGILVKMPKIGMSLTKARFWPEKTHQSIQQKLQEFMHNTRNYTELEMPLVTLADKLFHSLVCDVFLYTIPSFIAAKIAFAKMKKIAGKDLDQAFGPLEVALPHNVTTQMGLDLYHTAQLLPKGLTLKMLQDGLNQKSLPQPFMSAWEKFINTYGHRGPLEIDVAAPRYRDDPQLLLTILLSLQDEEKGDNPKLKFEKNQEKSRKAYAYIYEKIEEKSAKKAKQFKTLYKVFETFGGYRETHKFYLIFALSILREQILKKGKILHNAGRLQMIEQVFDLTLTEIDNAMADPSLNLIELAKKNTRFRNRLLSIPQLPTVIDSRGHILRPPAPPVKAGETAGTPISPGIVRGHIKVLHSPNEKILKKGEILVARATDPGWTPLFVNAGAVILEVGGVLQHGALVAREYGLPCVAGIQGATELWKDGTLVEVDGSAGIVRVLHNT